MTLIQQINPEDAKVLTQIALSAKRHWGYPERWMEIWTPQLTFTPDYFQENKGWVALDGEKLIAFYTMQDKNGIAWLENLMVLPEYIGRGIGKELFLHAMTLAGQRGYTSLQLEADLNAIGFYERIGMKKIGERYSEVDGSPRTLPIMKMSL